MCANARIEPATCCSHPGKLRVAIAHTHARRFGVVLRERSIAIHKPAITIPGSARWPLLEAIVSVQRQRDTLDNDSGPTCRKPD